MERDLKWFLGQDVVVTEGQYGIVAGNPIPQLLGEVEWHGTIRGLNWVFVGDSEGAAEPEFVVVNRSTGEVKFVPPKGLRIANVYQSAWWDNREAVLDVLRALADTEGESSLYWMNKEGAITNLIEKLNPPTWRRLDPVAELDEEKKG